MGAYAVDYVNTAVNNSTYVGSSVGAVNNSNYAGSAVSKTAMSSTVTSKAGTTAGTVLNVGGKILARANIWLTAAQVAYTVGSSIWDYFTKEEIEQMTETEKETVKQYESMQKVAETQQQKTQDVKDQTKAVADSVKYEQGQTLPSVLSQNAKALTLSVNALTSTLSEQLGLLNNYMMAGMLYQQQFLDLKTAESGLKIESMEYNKTAQTIKDLDGNSVATLAPRDAQIAKDATVAKDTTDKINFTLDEDGDIDDIIAGIDISSVFGYSGDADVIKEFYERLGGQGL